ncbi:MAG: DUF1501 domain-containing protein [Acidobacteriota bacterium]
MPRTDRRSFLLSAAAGAALPLWFPRVAFSSPEAKEAAGGDVLVCVFQRGGSDGLNVVAPTGDPRYHDLRPTLSLDEPGSASSSALDLDGTFAFHPSLAPLKELFDDGALAAVHAVGQPEETRSHFDAMDFIEGGTPGSKASASGWLGRHLDTLRNGNDSPFRAIGMSSLIQQSLRGPVSALALQSIADFHLEGDLGSLPAFQSTLGQLYSGPELLDVQGQQTLLAIEQMAAANPSQYQPANGATYPETPFGFGLRQIAQLIRASLGVEVACVDIGGWDTHEGQGGALGVHASLLDEMARGLAAFHADLDGLAQKVTVVVLSEFGRRAAENASGGTDHGRGNVLMVQGAGVRGGQVYGRWPGLEDHELVGPGDLAVTTDYRTVLAELLEKRLGNAETGSVFPDFTSPGSLGIFES